MSLNQPLTPPRPGSNGAQGPVGAAIVLGRVGRLIAESIDDYVKNGGYSGLRRAVELGHAKVLDTIEQAGLRGRGGAGFPTAKKWRIVADQPSSERYVIANAFGADPGALGDRILLENDPHSVLEGLAVAALAVGANRAFVYCCMDHKQAVDQIARAIRQAEERGFLGSGSLGSQSDLHVSVVAGPAGFAAGEETAAIALIEGKRPMPSQRPPYPAEAGLFGKPTVVNNAETLANVAWILQHDAPAYAKLGTGRNRGTKLITVTGAVNHSGVVEVPLGTTLRQVIAQSAGGIRAGRGLKAFQFGGPTGAILPESCLDTKIEFEAIEAVQSTMGSGSLLVLDETACVVDLLRARLDLLSVENCGRCVPCRLGTKRLHSLVEQVATGAGRLGDLELLAELSQNMADGAVCAFGVTGANPVLSALEHFRAELEAHLSERRCPANVCEVAATKTPDVPNVAQTTRREELWKSTWPIRR